MSKRMVQRMAAGWLVALGLATAGWGCKGEVDGEGNPPPTGSCDDYRDEAADAEVTVRMRNGRAEPIFLGSVNGCGGITPFTLRDGDGTVHPWHTDGCGFTCETLQSFSGACTADCAIPPVFFIAPGGHFDMTWDGTVLATVMMPDACFKERTGRPVSECERFVIPESGAYELTGEAFTEATGCGATGGACACTPSADGSCQVDISATVTGTPLSATSTMAYPDDALVEIVFD